MTEVTPDAPGLPFARTIPGLIGHWRQQAATCRADAERLGESGPAYMELLRDAAQYEQTAHQLQTISARPLPSDWVADGLKLVPIIPTEEMIARGDEIIAEDGKRVRPESVYDAMVSGAMDQREFYPKGPDAGWCSRCGCGNDSANFAHLQSCAAAPSAPAEVREMRVWQCPGCPTSVEYDGKSPPPCPRCDASMALDPTAKTAPEPLAQGIPQSAVEAFVRAVEALRTADPKIHAQSYRALEAGISAALAEVGNVYASPQPAAEGCTCPSGDGSLRWPCPKHPCAEIKAEAFPVEPLKVFDLGPWTWTETGHQFTGMDLDGAAFAAYRDYFNGLSTTPNPPQPSASVGELLALADEIDRQARECPTVDWRPNAHENARNLRNIARALTTAAGGGGEVGNG